MKIVKDQYNSKVSLDFVKSVKDKQYKTILADPPWRFTNRSGKMAPEHKRLNRYETLSLEEIMELPVYLKASETSHLYLWVPNALLPEGIAVMKAWGFQYKSNLIWHKVRKDGGPDGRGVGFYFRNTTEIVLFGIRGKIRTLQPGRSQVNIIRTQKQEHSRKPDELYTIIEKCSPGPFLEVFARGKRMGWDVFGNEAEDYRIDWETYANNSHGKKSKKLSIVEAI
jgi:N6-adenosine-specific RNA methylase IME4